MADINGVNRTAFIPKSVAALRAYSVRKLTSDLVAGVTVGLVALPLAMAFAIASGVSPQAGIYCAVVAGFLISALGGSMTQIGGPTGAFVVVVAGIVQKHGIDGLYMTTLMAGIGLMLLGLTGLGTAVKYIPRPVVVGFTNGIAVLIASTQIKDFFGLRIDKVPSELLERMKSVAMHWRSLSVQTTILAAAALLLIVLTMRFAKRVPGTILALFIGTGVAWSMGLPVETIESRFGGIPSGLPQLHVPMFRPDLILPLIAPALTVMMLGAIESLLSAVVADRMSGDKHNPNVELFAQGVANVMSPLFGGLPATGAIARTATNIRSGAKTPVAGMLHAVTLLVILLVASPLAKHIPLCVLAAILFVVAYNMGEWSEIPEILRLTKADISVWLITFALTVFADLTVAVEAGMILAALVYIRKVTNTTTVGRVTQAYIDDGRAHSLQINELPDGVAMYRIHGPFLFGAADKLSVIDEELERLPRIVLLRLRNMTAIDATGLHALESLADRLHASGRILLVCGMREQPARLLSQAEFHEHLGDANIHSSLAEALARAKTILAENGRGGAYV
jgi:SulP family sulfate permease